MTRYSTPLKGPHPMKQHPLFRTWSSMKDRCNNPRLPGYKNYGARGISVCHRWQESFWAFAADMGERPPGMSLDRINNDGNYEPSNCRWTTPKEQARNSRQRVTVRLLTLNDVTKPLYQWARDLGLTQETLGMRLANGWPLEHALTRPNCRVLGEYLHKHGEAPPPGSGRKKRAYTVEQARR